MDKKADLLERFSASLEEGTFVKLALGKYQGTGGGPRKLLMRTVELKGEPIVSLTFRHEKHDVTRNLTPKEACRELDDQLGTTFGAAHLFTTLFDIQLEYRPDNYIRRVLSAPTSAGTVPATHDRVKRRPVDVKQGWLKALGVTSKEDHVLPSMNDKWKQINRFVELLDDAIKALDGVTEAPPVLDVGCGKGYLTFAIHSYLRARFGAARVTGIELRPALVGFCEEIARKENLEGLSFAAGDMAGIKADPDGILVALHACDTASDMALARGIQARSRIIICAPCCHHEIRPQIEAPPVLRSVLRHGVNEERMAEMLTDSMRCLLMEAHGYTVKFLEFVSMEHTAKNTMIIAGRAGVASPEALRKLQELKAFFGIKQHALEMFLQADESTVLVARP